MLKRRIPKYSHHKATGQARVWIDGKDIYLGEHGSDESKRRYQNLIEEWRLREESPAETHITIGKLVVLYDRHVTSYYTKNGEPTSEVSCIKSALRPLAALFSNTWVGDFGPSKMKSVCKKMISEKRERKSINANIRRITRMFRWAVAEELCRSDIVTALECVGGLKKGRSEAVEKDDVELVPIERVEAIKTHISRPLWGAVQFQLANSL